MTNMASIANSRSYVAHDHYWYYCCWYHGISARTGNIDGSYRKDHQYKNRFLMWNPVMLGILTISHQVAMLLLYTAYLHTSGAFVIIIIITEQWACCTAWTLNIYIIFMSENAMYCYWRTYQCILKTSFFSVQQNETKTADRGNVSLPTFIMLKLSCSKRWLMHFTALDFLVTSNQY